MQAAAVVWARPVERYRVVRPLGDRPSGRAQLAEDRAHGGRARLVVVHAAHWSAARERERAVRLQEATSLVARIEHVHVLAVLDLFFSEDGRPCLVTEHVEGGTLADLLVARGGWLPPDEALVIACEVLDGLAAIHRAGMVHGALVPGSVRICPAGDGRPTVKIADVATGAGLPDPRRLDDGGAAWMRADVFAVASMLESMVAGGRRGVWQGGPFAGAALESLDGILRHALAARSGGFESAEALLQALLQIDRASLRSAPAEDSFRHQAAWTPQATPVADLASSGVRLVGGAAASRGRWAGSDGHEITASHRIAHLRRDRRDRLVLVAVLAAGLAMSALLCWVLLLALR